MTKTIQKEGQKVLEAQGNKYWPIYTENGDIIGELTIGNSIIDNLNTVISPILSNGGDILGWMISSRTELDTNHYSSYEELAEKRHSETVEQEG